MKGYLLLLFLWGYFGLNGICQKQALFFQRILPGETNQIDINFWKAPFDSVCTSSYSGKFNVGNSITFDLLGDLPARLEQRLRKVIRLSEETGIPVHFHLDGQNWTGARPDLWNWFDPESPGYDPKNKNNVEWTSWSPDSAVKICWRDWGRQIRILPAPNLFSPAILQAHYEGYDLLLPIIAAWKKGLPDSKKHLFGGIRIGWETGFNYNAYYYTNGNELYETYPRSTEHDPSKRVSTENFAPNNNTIPLGYAAAFTSGLKTNGKLTNRDYEELIFRYLNKLCKYVSGYGFTNKEIYTHMGGNYAPFDKHLKFWPAINSYATPGWSFYSLDPSQAGSLDKEMLAAGISAWAASEWLWPGENAGQWFEHLRKTYAFKTCRLLVIYNWEFMIDRNPVAREGIKKLLDE